MSAKKKPVSTPLHLLQQLTASLLDHFEQACAQALADAEKVLAKLEKQRVKVQEKLHKQHERIETAAAAGKRKAQAKARANVEALDTSLNELQGRQAETRQYIGELKNDIQASLALVQGVSKVREAAGKALESRPAKSAAGSGASVSPAAPGGPARKQTAAVQAIATASIGEAVSGAPKPRSRKPAPSQLAPLADGVAQATVSATVRRAPRKPRSAASSVPLNNATLTEPLAGEAPSSDSTS
jgi:phage-related tail protein